MACRLVGVIAGLVLIHATTSAQQAVRPDDVATIDGIVRAYYEVVSGPAGESVDLERDRTLHHAAWIAIARVDSSSITDRHGDDVGRVPWG